MKIPPSSFFIVFLGLCLSAPGQSVPPGAPVPPGYEPSHPAIYAPPYSGRSPAVRVDPAALEREAKELLELSQSVQSDVGSLRRGLLSKDLVDRLKRIERLSKRLRSEIVPLGN